MSQFVYGIHDENLLEYQGYIILTRAIGHNPDDKSGEDFSQWIAQGKTPIVRLNNGYHPDGTIPEQKFYYDFADRCGNFVENSQGCHIWIIGNEPNHEIERPSGWVIEPSMYARCFSSCRDEILSRVDHSEDTICIAAIAPWNVQTGDWLLYFEMVLRILDSEVDAISLHTYTHGSQPDLIFSEQTMDAPFEDRRFHFRAYEDFMERIPSSMQHLPVYITETNQTDPWLDVNSGWVKNAYSEIDEWNRGHKQQIRCLALYRWPKLDQWFIDGNDKVVDDFFDAVEFGYQWKDEQMPDWKVVYETSMPDFYDWNGIGELTVPVDSVPLWEDNPDKEGVLDRPEYDSKTTPQPEVYTPPKSAVCQCTRQTIEGALVWAVDVQPGDYVRASIYAMGVEESSGLGMRLGIAVTSPGDGAILTDNDTPSLLSKRAEWGDWWSVHSPDWQERGWKQLWSPVVRSIGGTVWIVANGRADFAGPGAAAHWDDLVVEAESNGGTEPPLTDGIQDALLKQIDVVQSELGKLSVMVEGMDKLAIPCVPLTSI